MKKSAGKKWRMFFLLVVLLGAAAFFLYRKYIAAGVHLKGKNYTYIFIGHDDDFDDVMNMIEAAELVGNMESFRWLATKMELHEEIHPGKYRINDGMNMRQIINLIRYNKEEKIKLTYNSQIRNLDEFVKYTDEKLELTDEQLQEFISDELQLKKLFDLDPDNCFAMIVPGTLEVGWAVSMEELAHKLRDRYKQVWHAGRIAQARKIGFTVPEVITIASIVQGESSIDSERKKIAGVYINRLRIGMPLQADPTLKFANGNFSAMRVLDVDKKINSPYNTYMYKGLPPGPISLVSINAIDATLNYAHHKFLYFCAKPQLNGYSDFSTTYSQHLRYAAAYQKHLNKIGISR